MSLRGEREITDVPLGSYVRADYVPRHKLPELVEQGQNLVADAHVLEQPVFLATHIRDGKDVGEVCRNQAHSLDADLPDPARLGS